MVNLDDLGQLKELDPKDVYGSTEKFTDQCKQIWEAARKLNLPENFASVQNIVVCGMGGSAYGGYVIAAAFKDSLKVPLISSNDYHLPNFASSNTLAILSSYSGSTEEVLSCASEALSKGLKITGITGGGKVGELLGGNGLIFDPKFNPSGQPRLGTGYMVLGTIALLNRIGLINISDKEVEDAIAEIEAAQEEIKLKAKQLAKEIYGNIPVILGAEFLLGNIHILRNQFNETAKSFSAFSPLPELNHHLMEGLKNPADKKLTALFINSELYSDKLKKRVELTKDVVSKNGISAVEYMVSGSTKISQVLNVLSLGGYLTFYLAMLYNQDPSVIPWVDYFKRELERST